MKRLRNQNWTQVAFVLWILTAISCIKEQSISTDTLVIQADTALGLIIADTITYDVIILNPNPDDSWTEECLRTLHHKELIDNIFNMINSEKADAYDYTTNERLTNKQLQRIENESGFSRDQVGMIQFTEIWHIHPGKSTMTKRVHSMVLGYNFYTGEGELFGYKPLFRVELNRENQ